MSIHAVINRWAGKPFGYGRGLDCCQFAGEVIEELTGHNPMSAFTYANKWQAWAIIAEYGSLRTAVSATLGDEVPATEARDGDPLLVDVRTHLPRMAELVGDEMIGVCWKGRCVVRTNQGVTDWPLEWATAAWRATP